ncbi:MAG: hypothetical protein ACRD0V_20755 [Acidimicrobiales bacterium]
MSRQHWKRTTTRLCGSRLPVEEFDGDLAFERGELLDAGVDGAKLYEAEKSSLGSGTISPRTDSNAIEVESTDAAAMRGGQSTRRTVRSSAGSGGLLRAQRWTSPATR